MAVELFEALVTLFVEVPVRLIGFALQRPDAMDSGVDGVEVVDGPATPSARAAAVQHAFVDALVAMAFVDDDEFSPHERSAIERALRARGVDDRRAADLLALAELRAHAHDRIAIIASSMRALDAEARGALAHALVTLGLAQGASERIRSAWAAARDAGDIDARDWQALVDDVARTRNRV